MAFKQVTIIGTGLIGGSLGLALKKRRLAGRILGCDRAPVLERAQECGAIEGGSTNPADAVRGSDLVVLATPVIPILDLDRPARSRAAAQDAGNRCRQHQGGNRGARREIVWAKRRAQISGRASHGGQRKRRRGVCRCRSFRRRCLAVHAASRPERPRRTLRRICSCAEKMGAKIAVVDPADHDRFCAWISHCRR